MNARQAKEKEREREREKGRERVAGKDFKGRERGNKGDRERES